jgi:hypothetical protein
LAASENPSLSSTTGWFGGGKDSTAIMLVLTEPTFGLNRAVWNLKASAWTASQYYSKCYRTIRVKRDTKYIANSEHTWIHSAKTTEYISGSDASDIFEFTSSDPECKVS